jgi:hypothetical protein
LVGENLFFFNKIKILFLKEKLQEKRDEEEQQIIPSNSDLHIYDDQVAICIDTKSTDLQVNNISNINIILINSLAITKEIYYLFK